ncbi:PRC-barrel domain-containing protein [Dietzia aurantiaca]|uniref:PRC-barrel domain-containing protein n=1 Tax=Dietzia aurantiaca TaxID=983873 RepID=UPI001E574189|nr:PRC-barrel domain-containing protein [Dietzia aurantiaca]MCD2263965.1 PRC-barrel domain-containing protein [Dietzia aurantiaca]
MIDKEQLDRFYGTVVYDSSGEKIGKLNTVYLDDRTDEPTFATVSTSMLVTTESFVPLRGARVDGSEIHVQFTKEQVKNAPRVEVGRDLTPAEENRLYEYYQLDGGGTDAAGSARPAGPALEAERARLRKHDHRRGDD